MEEEILGLCLGIMFKRFLNRGSPQTHESWISRIRKNPFNFILALLIIINITLLVINAGLWISAAYQKLFVRADFTSFYTGFYMVRVGEGSNLYDPALQSSYQQQFMGGITFEGGVLLFPNPPFVAIVFSPLSLLPLGPAFYLWTLVQSGLLIWVLFSLNRLFAHWDNKERIILIIAILAFWPLTYNFLLGQFSLFLVIGLLQMYIAMKHSKLTRAGLWLFLLSIKPHTLLLPGMLTLNRRYWRVAVTALITGLIIFLVTWLMIGLKPWMDYLRSLQSIGSYFGKFGVTPSTEYTFRGVLSNILGNSRGSLINILSTIILLLGMIYVWLLWRKGIPQDDSRFSLYFAFTILLSVFISLHLNPHDSLVLILPAAIFYDFLRGTQAPRRVYSIWVLISPLVFFISAFTRYKIFGIIHLPIIMILVLLGWMIYYLVVDHRREETLPVILKST